VSLLTIVQNAADRLGVARPTSVVGSSDTQVRQMYGLTLQEGRELSRRGPWQALTTEKTITATATEEQSGALPADFDRMIEGSFWNRTQDRRVVGPVDPQRWQAIKTGLFVSVWDAFRIRGDALLMTPTPTENDSLAYEYVSSYWCTNAAGDTTKVTMDADDDVARLCEECITLGLMWRFLKAKGLDYSEAFRTYEMEVAKRLANDGGMRPLDLNDCRYVDGFYDPYVTDGNWSI